MSTSPSRLPESVSALITAALAEDVGSGDVTSEFFVSAEERCEARIFAKQRGVLAGGEVAVEVFRQLDPQVHVTLVCPDGAALSTGQTVMVMSGPARSVLTGERTALNFLQRLSGIATLTNHFTQAVADTSTRILDTRKTTPGWRWLEKYAVRVGGGTNHRIGLYDRVMVKDNHLLAEGALPALQAAIDRVHALHPTMEIELEADSLEQVKGFLTLRGVNYILLDNMSLHQLRECVETVRASGQKVALEASGGVTLDTVRDIADTGVDFISSGALTHSAKALDLSLEITQSV
jgi:nicotinate-nucleotide pyrophosphorylase (carboxylating)